MDPIAAVFHARLMDEAELADDLARAEAERLAAWLTRAVEALDPRVSADVLTVEGPELARRWDHGFFPARHLRIMSTTTGRELSINADLFMMRTELDKARNARLLYLTESRWVDPRWALEAGRTHAGKLAGPFPTSEHYAAVMAILEGDESPEAQRARMDTQTQDRLVRELVTRSASIVALLGASVHDVDAPDPVTPDGFAEGFARILSDIGALDYSAAVVEKTAGWIREVEQGAPGARAWLFAYDPRRPIPRWLGTLAGALWVAKWSPEIERELRHKSPGLTYRTSRALVSVLSPAARVYDGPVVTEIVSLAGRLAGKVESDDVRRMMVPTVNAEAVRHMTSEIVKARAATAAVYALLHAVFTVNDLDNQGDKSLRSSWESWSEWTADVSSTFDVRPTDDLAGALKLAAWFGNAVQVPLFDGRIQRGLWTLTAPDPFKRGAPRAGSRVVTFGYAPIFSPGWASEENPGKNRGVRLVTIPRKIPIGVADRVARAPVMLFTLDVLAELAMCANPKRGTTIAAPRRAELGRGVGLSDAYAVRQLSAMAEAGLIEVVGHESYRLGSEDARLKACPKNKRTDKKRG